MKSAQIAMWASRPSNNANAPQFYGTVQIPAALVVELYGLMQQGQGMETNRDGEQVFRLRHSTWRRDGQNNGPIASGEIKSPGEEAAYKASKGGGSYAAAPAAGPLGHGGPAAAPVQPPVQPSVQPPTPQPLSEPQWNGSGWVAWDGAQWRASAPPAPLAHSAPAMAAPPVAAPAGWGAPQQPAPPVAAQPAPGGWGAQPTTAGAW
jgi:hypothetical protein